MRDWETEDFGERPYARWNINKKVWKRFSEKETQAYVDKVFNYYRTVRGFPYYPTDKKWRGKEFRELMAFDVASVIDGDIINQTMHGLSLAWSYFPHSWEVRCNGFKTPYEVFYDDELFRKVIRKRIDIGDNMSDSGIRKMLRIYTGVQSVSNFRPTAAAAIYQRFANGGIVWDMSGGFGGRLLGAVRAGVRRYIATDPSEKTYNGLVALNDDYGRGIGELHMQGSEDFVPAPGSLDLCFTSPPYFDTERYSDEASQSYNRFPTQEQWRAGFLQRTFENCMVGLKPGGHMIINVSDVKSYKTLEQDTVRTARAVGFTLVSTLKLVLSSMTTSSENLKYEPVFVFRKDCGAEKHDGKQ